MCQSGQEWRVIIMRHGSIRHLAALIQVGCLVGLALSPLPAAADPVPKPAPVAYQLGTPARFGRLTVAPLLSQTTGNPGDYTSLDAALAAKTALVQEIGADRPHTPEPNVVPQTVRPNAVPSPVPPAEDHVQQPRVTPAQNQVQVQVQQVMPGGGARVNTLEIVNTGKRPILVLAGTIVKGGKQDRQIGQDFIIEPGQKVPVDAFCVEHGRWNASRAGKDTAGKFETAQILANQAVRAAGQYEQNQSMVWAKVSETNRAAGAQTASDTLSATLDNDAVAKARKDLARSVSVFLDGSRDKRRFVGLAFGIDGTPRSVRWFATPALFGLFRETLVNTAAFDAVTAPQSAAGTVVSAETLTQPAFIAFMNRIRQAPTVDRRKTAAGNVNVVWRADSGYGSEARRVTNGKETAITADFLAK
jgi:hypothetical protein